MEKERMNVAEILRNCQAGMNLDCVCFENVVFDRVDDKNRIRCFVGSQRDEVSFNEYGCLNGSPSAKCVIFPKGEATWAGFQVPFKDGDMLIGKAGQPFIFKKLNNFDGCSSYCGIDINGKFHLESVDWTFAKSLRFATEAEKRKLFDAIRANGYRWDSEIKTLEKLPRFYVGDWVIDKQGIVHQIANVIENVTNHTYGYDIVGGGYFNDNTEGVRLWTIQDAKDGDVLTDHCDDYKNPLIFILKKFEKVDFGRALKSDYSSYCFLTMSDIPSFKEGSFHHKHDIKPATKEQCNLLFQKMKEAGYEWDAETKTLKKLPKFKVGDNIRFKGTSSIYGVTEIREDRYMLDDKDIPLLFKMQDEWELVPDKFDINTLVPFESRVLVRDTKEGLWRPAIWGGYVGKDNSYYCVLGGIYWKHCIPYEGNEHLVGKIDDCDEYFKTWE